MMKRKIASIQNRLRLSNSFQRVLAQLHPRMPEPTAWVFVVGCYNSGTTLLTELLRLSEHVSSLPWEGVALTHHLKRCDDFGLPRMWWKVEDQIIDAETGLGASEAIDIRRQWGFSSCPSGDRPIFLEKSITNALRIPYLAEHFSPAVFLHIVRDPVAACEGIRRKARPEDSSLPPYSLEDCTTMWSRSNSLITKNLIGQKHFTVRYEDFCTDPAAGIQEIEEFLHEVVPNIPPLSIEIPPDGPRVHGKVMKIKNQNRSSYQKLSTEEISAIRILAGDLLSEFGYGEEPPGDVI